MTIVVPAWFCWLVVAALAAPILVGLLAGLWPLLKMLAQVAWELPGDMWREAVDTLRKDMGETSPVLYAARWAALVAALVAFLSL